MSSIAKTSLLSLLIGVLACAGGGDGPKNSGSAAATSDPASPSGENPQDEEAEQADEAQQVAGSFLVGCSDETLNTFVENEAKSQDLVACAIDDGSGKLVEATQIELKVRTKSGVEIPVETVVKETQAPWLLGFRLPAEQSSQGVVVNLTFKQASGDATLGISTESLDFDWANSKLFKTFVKIMKAYYAGKEPKIEPFDRDGGIAQFLGAGRPHQIVFVTEDLVQGDFGIDQADSLCAESGAKVDATRTWSVFLSTKDRPASNPVDAEVVLFNFAGAFVAVAPDFAKIFNLVSPIRYTQTGADVGTVLVPASPLPHPITRAWVGLDGEGKVGDLCNDWTSQDAQTYGTSVDANDVGTGVIQRGRRPCSRRSRLICVSSVK